MADGMNAIVAELRGLSPAKRRCVLAELNPGERRAVEALLREQEEPPPGEPVPTRSSFVDELSPALKTQVTERLRGEAADLTEAGLKALRLALDTLSRPDSALTSGAGIAKPSLLKLIGRNLSGKRQRA